MAGARPLTGRAVVVTGADRSDGAAIADAFAAAGADLVLTGDDAPAVATLAARLHDTFGARVAVAAGPMDDAVLTEMVTELFGRK
jgi:NAD(P)-dependent dehydrogenase (short-subunit alcohol dehydrogenase family)